MLARTLCFSKLRTAPEVCLLQTAFVWSSLWSQMAADHFFGVCYVQTQVQHWVTRTVTFFSLNGLESARSRPRCHGELLQSRFCVFGGFDIAFAPGRAAMLLRTIAWTCSNLYCLNSYSFRAVFLLCEHSFRPFAAAAADSQCSRSCVAANLFLPR